MRHQPRAGKFVRSRSGEARRLSPLAPTLERCRDPREKAVAKNQFPTVAEQQNRRGVDVLLDLRINEIVIRYQVYGSREQAP